MRLSRSALMYSSVPTGTPMTVMPSVAILTPWASALSRSRCETLPLLTRSLHFLMQSFMPVSASMTSAMCTMLSRSSSPSPYRSTSSAKPPAPAVATLGWAARSSVSIWTMASWSATAKRMVAMGSPCLTPDLTQPTNPCTAWNSFEGLP